MYTLRVKDIYDVGNDYYVIHIENHGVNSHDQRMRQTVKQAFATLRKAMNAYRLHPEYASIYPTDSRYHVKGNYWCLHKQLLLHFAPSLQFWGPLERLLLEATLRTEYSHRQYNQEQYSDSSYHSVIDDAWRFFGLSATATEEEVKQQYRQLAKLYHPDTGGDETNFKLLQQANAILKRHLETSTSRE